MYIAAVAEWHGGSVQASTNVVVTKLNNSPIISSVVANPLTLSTGAVSVITCSASDADNDTLTYAWSAASGTITGTGSAINWTSPASSSTYIINIIVTDGQGGSVQASTNVVVTKVNNSPIISSVVANPASIPTGAVTTITCSATDPDDDPLAYNWTAGSGTFSTNGSSTTVWTAPVTADTYAITCTVTDSNGVSVQQSVNINVSHELPDTGFGLSYTTTFGEDHDYQPATSQPSYGISGDGTTTDNRTGLMWVTNGASAACNNGNALTWEAALNFCEGLTFASYSDWRLPNVRELESIVKPDVSLPTVNTGYFPNTVNGDYWTSTTSLWDTSMAWQVSFGYGEVGQGVKTSATTRVRCVRAGP